MSKLSRRHFLNQVGIGAASAAALAATGCATADSAGSNASTPMATGAKSLTGPFLNVLESAEDNMTAYARLQGNLDSSKVKYGWYKGMVSAVMPDKVVTDLFMMEGFSCARLLPIEGGVGYHKVLREVGFYREQRFGRAGKIMQTWKNPLTKEDVNVVPIANDPFNYDITPFFPEPPNYGGLNAGQPFPKIPFKLPWNPEIYNNNVRLDTRINLYYPNALDPEQWPRESSGKMNRVSEIFQYNIDLDNLQDSSQTTTKYNGTWVRVTPWLPWMLMGSTPGHILYTCYMGTVDSLDMLPEDLVAAAAAIDPKYLDAPTEVYGPSLSSLERYALEQTPAPAKE
jgi:hypothetical protein